MALLLAIAPLLWAGSEKEVVPVTPSDMLERNVPTTVTYVNMPGLAMPVAVPGPGGSVAPPYGLLVRDDVDEERFTIVSTPIRPERLLVRYVVGRVVARAGGAEAASAFAARGEGTSGLNPGLWLIEVSPAEDEEPRQLVAVADLASLPEGTLVRLPLAFDAESLPTCALATAGCPDRLLAAGRGIFVQLARGVPDPDPVLVQTGYPSSVAPGRWAGPQVRNGPELQAFVDTTPIQALAAWGRILQLASVVDDPGLIRDKLWLGPILLVLLAGLLWAGGRVGYPIFRPVLQGSRRWTDAPARGTVPAIPIQPGQRIPVRVSGHARTIEGRRRHLDETPAVLQPSSTGAEGARATAALRLPDGEEIALAAYDIGALGSVERGEVVRIGDLRPALWAHWFGTDLRLTFESAAERDLAAGIASRGGSPLGSDR